MGLTTDLAPEQDADAQRLDEALPKPSLDEARRLARMLAAPKDSPLLGPTEFQVRGAVPRPGASAPPPPLRADEGGYQGSSMRPLPRPRSSTARLAMTCCSVALGTTCCRTPPGPTAWTAGPATTR